MGGFTTPAPGPKRRQPPQPGRTETRGRRLGRRLRAVNRFAVKHRGSLMCLAGAAGVAVSLLVFEVGVLSVQTLLSGGILLAGAVVHHHQKTSTTRRSPSVQSPSWRERRTMDNNRRGGNFFDGTPHGQGGRVTVTSHDRTTGTVRQHTRARPNPSPQDGAAS